MAGGSFHASLATLSWPTGEFGGMNLEGAVRLGFRKELEAIEVTFSRSFCMPRLLIIPLVLCSTRFGCAGTLTPILIRTVAGRLAPLASFSLSPVGPCFPLITTTPSVVRILPSDSTVVVPDLVRNVPTRLGASNLPFIDFLFCLCRSGAFLLPLPSLLS